MNPAIHLHAAYTSSTQRVMEKLNALRTRIISSADDAPEPWSLLFFLGLIGATFLI